MNDKRKNGNYHILIIDDLVPLSKMIDRVLRRDFQTHIANNGYDARTILSENPINAVLTDYVIVMNITESL